eukprot:6510606-Prymnesium_polylepis.1
MLRKLDELELAQLPALVYQLLLLADASSKAPVLRALNAHFEKLATACSEASSQAQRSGDGMECARRLRRREPSRGVSG